MSTPNQDQEFWKRKLLAFLHDPPDKAFGISNHENLAESYQTGAGLDPANRDQIAKTASNAADRFDASAERFVFPKVKCSTNYTGSAGECFIHPLSSGPYTHSESFNPAELHEILKNAIQGVPTSDHHQAFFLYWRRWMENAVTANGGKAAHLAFAPADTRIPDHTIWTHMNMASALSGCWENNDLKPAMLLFQLGPVQDFIAQARSARDLWSGSYLLSWLIAHAMKAVTDEIGPDAIIFPSLRGNGIFDALHRDTIYATQWTSVEGKAPQTTWERILDEKRTQKPNTGDDPAARWLLTPTLPNRFLALVPESQAERLAEAAKSAISKALTTIGETVWKWIEKEARAADCSNVLVWKARWDAQLAAFPQITWAVQPWLERDECLQLYKELPINDLARKEEGKPIATPSSHLQAMLDLAEKELPVEHRDKRYYSDDCKTRLNNPGILWSAHYALVDAKLAARRNTRDFQAWTDPCRSENGTPKDSLSGKEEIIGDEKFWDHLHKSRPFDKSTHRYGAMNLIKRLWCLDDLAFLNARLGLKRGDFNKAIRFDLPEEIAKGNEFKGRYVAILAMDGDEMGKWITGEKTPQFLKQLSAKAKSYLAPILMERNCDQTRRLLTPSYHLQFSEALANFATWLAEPIVQAHQGQLIYAGGDDVLAMLPADRAIACAEALRAFFRGQLPRDPKLYRLHVPQDGYVVAEGGYPLLVPGPDADVSAGIAIGHINAPLQMLVREAQKAEKIAKTTYGRGAMALSLYKRSGEIIEWGCKWDDAGKGNFALTLMRQVTEWTKDAKDASGKEIAPSLSGRFPYALAALLAPYKLALKPSIDQTILLDIIRKEVVHAVSRQGARLDRNEKERLLSLTETWLLQTQTRLQDFINLFLAETFITRNRGEN
jgi:CRISPR-associated protein Cmr2